MDENQNHDQNQTGPENNFSSDQFESFSGDNDSSPVINPAAPSKSRGWLTTVIIIIIILGVAYWFWDIGQSNAPTSLPPEFEEPISSPQVNNSSSSPSVSAAGFSALIDDQFPSDSILLNNISLTVDSWVAVREETNAQPGNILGALWLPAGAHLNQSVELLRPAAAGTHYIVFFADNGDKIFDHKVDPFILTTFGEPLNFPFAVIGPEE